MSINIDFTEEDVYNFLKNNLNIKEDILLKFKQEKIDGEALILLRKNDYKNLGIKLKDKNKILENTEKNIFKMKKDIQKEDLYIKVVNSSKSGPWDFLNVNSNQIKLGEKLKYIKYIFIKNQPPNKENTNELFNYLKTYLKADEDIVKQIAENIKDILDFNEQQFEEQCQELDLTEDDEQFKLKIIVKLMKLNEEKIKSKSIREGNIQTPNDILQNFIKTGKKLKLNILSNEDIDLNTIEIISLDGEYNIYSMIELYNYETSQEDIASGLRNPINEFQKLCKDFNIDFEKDGTFIDYQKATKIKISTSMLWGTKESLEQFFIENGINNAISYFKHAEVKDKAGIYLCINKESLNALLILWPGNLDYQYTKIDEPNDNILLTLIRYGFTISSNSILCFTKDEIKKFNFDGYKIFEDVDTKAFDVERSKIIINTIKQKIFTIGEKKEIKLDAQMKFKNKITNNIINQNCLLLYEEKENSLNTKTNINNIEDFLKFNSEYDIFFDNNFEYIKPSVFYILIRNNHLFLKEIQNEKNYFSILSLKDAFKNKINKEIDDLIKPIYEKLLAININNLNSFIKCQTYGKPKSNDSQDVIYIKKKYNGANMEINTSKNIHDEEAKIIMYEQLKKFSEIISISNNRNDYKSEILKKYYQNCLKKFKYFNKVFDLKIILDEIENIKEEFTEENFEKLKKEIIWKEIKIYENLNKNKKEYEEKSKEWEKKWRNKINNYIIDSNIKKYIKIKSCQLVKNGNANIPNKLTDWKVEYEYIENIHKENYINLYEIKPKKDSSNLMLIFSRELGPENFIENYFSSHNNGLIIGKERDILKINFKNKKIQAYKGLYDFDKNSDTLILYREEENEKKIGIYSREEKSKTINCNQYVLDDSIIYKIMLVPCYQAYENQSFLLFVDKEIHMIQINNENEFPKIINLDREFNYKNFREFRFIVHFDFLLILHYNIQEKKWKGKVFSLCLEDDSFFDFIREIELDEEDNKVKFSFAEIKEKKFLISVKVIGNIPVVNYWEINARLSGISSDYQKKHKKHINNDISLGNCVINYFYHCFEKYPLLSALHYKFQKYDKKSIKLHFYLKDDLSDAISSLEKYIEELKKCFEKKKKLLSMILFSVLNKIFRHFLLKKQLH